MVEIAICLAVIGFALVAIIGVLPSAMNFQRDNREETIIDQDATYWLEAIRAGAKGLDHLTNHVANIRLLGTNYETGGPIDETYRRDGRGLIMGPYYADSYELIGLLGVAGYRGLDRDYWSAEAEVHAISGPAVERDPASIGLKYRMRVEIRPVLNWNPDLFQEEPGLDRVLANYTNAMLREIQLHMEWPWRASGPTRSRKVYRSVIQGSLTKESPRPGTLLSFFER